MSNLEIALDCIKRGWYVLPIPRDGKNPLFGLVPHGVLDSTLDEDKVRHWWGKAKPSANVGIACGKSRLAAVDCDHGNDTVEDFNRWVLAENLPVTYTVRSGRRSNFGTHSLFSVPEEIASGTWERNGHGGEIRSRGYYVLAAGSVHKDTGELYTVLIDAPVAPLPEHVRLWRPERKLIPSVERGELDALRIGLEALGVDYEDRGDKLYVRCPWAKEHSMESGPSETALFVKDGWYCFKCHHASCDKRTYGQYRSEVAKAR